METIRVDNDDQEEVEDKFEDDFKERLQKEGLREFADDLIGLPPEKLNYEIRPIMEFLFVHGWTDSIENINAKLKGFLLFLSKYSETNSLIFQKLYNWVEKWLNQNAKKQIQQIQQSMAKESIDNSDNIIEYDGLPLFSETHKSKNYLNVIPKESLKLDNERDNERASLKLNIARAKSITSSRILVLRDEFFSESELLIPDPDLRASAFSQFIKYYSEWRRKVKQAKETIETLKQIIYACESPMNLVPTLKKIAEQSETKEEENGNELEYIRFCLRYYLLLKTDASLHGHIEKKDLLEGSSISVGVNIFFDLLFLTGEHSSNHYDWLRGEGQSLSDVHRRTQENSENNAKKFDGMLKIYDPVEFKYMEKEEIEKWKKEKVKEVLFSEHKASSSVNLEDKVKLAIVAKDSADFMLSKRNLNRPVFTVQTCGQKLICNVMRRDWNEFYVYGELFAIDLSGGRFELFNIVPDVMNFVDLMANLIVLKDCCFEIDAKSQKRSFYVESGLQQSLRPVQKIAISKPPNVSSKSISNQKKEEPITKSKSKTKSEPKKSTTSTASSQQAENDDEFKHFNNIEYPKSMMQDLLGEKIEQTLNTTNIEFTLDETVYDEDRTIVLKTTNKTSNTKVVLKLKKRPLTVEFDNLNLLQSKGHQAIGKAISHFILSEAQRTTLKISKEWTHAMELELLHPLFPEKPDVTIFSDKFILTVSIQLVKAINDLHNNFGLLHLDLKPDNVMLQSNDFQNPIVKLIDMEGAIPIAYCQKKKLKWVRSTNIFAAPEVRNLDEKPSNLFPSADVYGLGYLISMLIFGGYGTPSIYQNGLQGNRLQNMSSLNLSKLMKSVFYLSREMTRIDAKERPSVAMCLSDLEKKYQTS